MLVYVHMLDCIILCVCVCVCVLLQRG